MRRVVKMFRFAPVFILSLVASYECSDYVTKTTVQIGGYFNDDEQTEAFRSELIKRSTHKLSFEPKILSPAVTDSFTTLKEVCTRTKIDSWAALVDGTQVTGTCGALCQLLHKVEIPHLVISWRPAEASAESNSSFGLAYYPQPSTLSRAYAAYIKIEKWTHIVLLYEDPGGLIRLQRIMTSHPINNDPLIIRRLDPKGDNMGIFKELILYDKVVVDCSPQNVVKYLEEITIVDSKIDFHRYLFTSLDTHTVDLSSLSEYEFHITTMHMTFRDWNYADVNGGQTMLQTALATDAATHVSWALEKMLSRDKNFTKIPPICQKNQAHESYDSWKNGRSLIDLMEEEGITGKTGNVQFESGYRTNFVLQISEASKESFLVKGFWNSSTDEITQLNDNKPGMLLGPTKTKKKIKVVARGSKPYFGYNNDTDSFEGFSVDLITEIFKIINEQKPNGKTYEFEFYKAEGNAYESMMKDLEERKADLGICDLTMTSERQQRVDFSAPFMSLGITILALKEQPQDPHMFSFLDPLALDLWLCLATAYVFVSYVLLISARMSQEDWVNPHPCDRNPEALENIWSIHNCFWLSMGTIMTQGCDILPRAAGSRWVTGMWWFFTLIITASYTANMSTFLSENRRVTQITSVRDLITQNKIKYGTVALQSTYKFFQNSNDTVYKKIFSVMESERPSVYAVDADEGLERVLKGKSKYVFFMESTSAEYYAERNNCSLEIIGGRLDSKEYGIAMARGDPIRPYIDAALLDLQEGMKIVELKEKWWEKMDNSQGCTVKAEEKEKELAGSGDSLQMEDTSGIFVVLLAGALIGIILALIDFVMHAHRIAVVEQVSWREALLSEWRSSLDPRVLSKPVAPPRSAAPSEDSSRSAQGQRSTSRAVSVLRAAQSFIDLRNVH